MNRTNGKPKFTYHYFAEVKLFGGLEITIDGIANKVEKIKTMEDYQDFKKQIVDGQKDVEWVKVKSLTLIDEV